MNEPIEQRGNFVMCSSMFGAACVDLGSGDDTARWCTRFAVTEERLRVIVGKVGPMANAVHAYIASKGFSS